MEKLRPVMLYIVGLVGLIAASVMVTGHIDGVAGEPPAPLPVASHAGSPTNANRSNCVPTAMSISYSYKAGAPFTTTLAPPDLGGERLIISGIVYASNAVTPIPDAVVEVWQADAGGHYEYLHAQTRTDAAGHYKFTTIKPGHIHVDCQVMPAHIHYRVSYPPIEPLLTILFFKDDPYLAGIPPVEPSHIKPLVTETAANGPVLHATFDFVLPVYLD